MSTTQEGKAAVPGSGWQAITAWKITKGLQIWPDQGTSFGWGPKCWQLWDFSMSFHAPVKRSPPHCLFQGLDNVPKFEIRKTRHRRFFSSDKNVNIQLQADNFYDSLTSHICVHAWECLGFPQIMWVLEIKLRSEKQHALLTTEPSLQPTPGNKSYDLNRMF